MIGVLLDLTQGTDNPPVTADKKLSAAAGASCPVVLIE